MIAVVLGTTGELIKVAPLLRKLEERGERALVLCTGQQAEQLPEFFDDLSLPHPDLWLARGHRGADLGQKSDVPMWLGQVVRTFVRHRGEIKRRLGPDPTVVVHGDTMTTVIGAVLGRAIGARVAHLEAGLRSGDWRNPFPEEINRRVAAKLATLHLAPGPEPVAALRREGAPGEIVDTVENTIFDALGLAASAPLPDWLELPQEPFGLVSIHRFELIERREAFREVLEILREHARTTPLLFVDHSVTAAAIAEHGLDDCFDDRFRRIPRLRYTPFISLLRRASYLVTDSGGSQEECAFLGIPCLVHRVVTERSAGLDGGPVVLTGGDLDVLREFLRDPLRHRREPYAPPRSPTEIALQALDGNAG